MSKELRCANDHIRESLSVASKRWPLDAAVLWILMLPQASQRRRHAHTFKLPHLVWASDQHKYEPTSPSQVLCQMKKSHLSCAEICEYVNCEGVRVPQRSYEGTRLTEKSPRLTLVLGTHSWIPVLYIGTDTGFEYFTCTTTQMRYMPVHHNFC